MTFKEKLVILRKAKGLTQDEFASAVGVSRQAVYKWECGQSYPEVPKLLEMKLLFSISIDDLLDDNYDIPLPEKKKRKRIPKETMRDIEKSVQEEVSRPAAEKKAAPAPKAEAVKEIPAAPVEKEKAEAPIAEEKIFIPVIKEVAKETTVKIPTIQEVEATPLVDEVPAPEETPVVITPVITENEEEPKKVGLFGRLFGRK